MIILVKNLNNNLGVITAYCISKIFSLSVYSVTLTYDDIPSLPNKFKYDKNKVIIMKQIIYLIYPYIFKTKRNFIFYCNKFFFH